MHFMKKKTQQSGAEAIIKRIEKKRDIFEKYGVRKIGLFGSFAKKKQRNGSDLDFLVVLENPTFDNYMELKFTLEKMFHKKVDLVIEENLKPALRYVKEEALYAKRL